MHVYELRSTQVFTCFTRVGALFFFIDSLFYQYSNHGPSKKQKMNKLTEARLKKKTERLAGTEAARLVQGEEVEEVLRRSADRTTPSVPAPTPAQPSASKSSRSSFKFENASAIDAT